MRRTAWAGMALATCMCCSVGSVHATTIGFDPLPGLNEDAYTGHTEAGFSVIPVAGDWRQAHFFGNPTPSIFQLGAGTGIIELANLGTGLFTFSGVEIADANPGQTSDLTLDIVGLLGASTVFSATGLGTGPAGTFIWVPSPDPVSVIDRLRLSLIDPTGSSSNFDNIKVFAVGSPVPEPGTMVLLGSGLIGLAGYRRKKKT